MRAHLIRSALCLLPLLAIYIVPLALGQRQISGPSQRGSEPGIPDSTRVSPGSPFGQCNGWQTGPDMPTTAVRMVGIYFSPTVGFYAMGGRNSDLPGSDFAHPFEYDTFTQTWTIKSAAFPDNQVTTWLAAQRP